MHNNNSGQEYEGRITVNRRVEPSLYQNPSFGIDDFKIIQKKV